MAHFLWFFWGPVGSCVTADVLVVLLGCLLGCGGWCLCCWTPAVVAFSGFAARRFWKDPNHQICYLPI